MDSVTLGAIALTAVGVVWTYIRNQSEAAAKPVVAPINRYEPEPVVAVPRIPGRGEAFMAWLKIEAAMRAQNATPEQIRAAGLACISPLIVGVVADES